MHPTTAEAEAKAVGMAAKGEEVELLDEWQHLSSSSSPPSPKWHDSLLIHDNYVLQEESAFPPSLHENLDHVPRPKPPLLSSSSFVDSSSDDEPQQLVAVPLDNESKEDGFRVVYLRSCSLLGAVYRVVRNWSFLGWGAWARVSASAAAGIVAVVVMSWAYAKFRKLKSLRLKRSRAKEESAVVENLVLLVKQKEERISQLMLQIARMNEVMLAQRRVPVLRVS